LKGGRGGIGGDASGGARKMEGKGRREGWGVGGGGVWGGEVGGGHREGGGGGGIGGGGREMVRGRAGG